MTHGEWRKVEKPVLIFMSYERSESDEKVKKVSIIMKIIIIIIIIGGLYTVQYVCMEYNIIVLSLLLPR